MLQPASLRKRWPPSYRWTCSIAFQRRAWLAKRQHSLWVCPDCADERDPKSVLPQEKNGQHQQLSYSSRVARAAAGPRETRRWGTQVVGRVSWESAEDEKYGFQDANLPEKWDSLVFRLQETFWSCSYRIFSSWTESEFLSGKSSKDTKKAWEWRLVMYLLLAMAKAFNKPEWPEWPE